MPQIARGDAVLPAARGATVHGVYDAMLGGTMHLRADRELAAAIEAEFPQVPVHVRAAADFHLRVARWCAWRRVTRFIRAGAVTWQPGGRNVHEAARLVTRRARTVYVNRDPEAHRWAQALLARDRGTAAVLESVASPAALLAAPPVAALLAPGEPVCMIIGMVLHFSPPERAAARVADYAAALPPGSFLAVSLSLPDDSPRAGRLLEMYTPSRVFRHTAGDVTRWYEKAGLELVPPGVADVRALPGCGWGAAGLPPRAPGMTAGALGAVP